MIIYKNNEVIFFTLVERVIQIQTLTDTDWKLGGHSFLVSVINSSN